MNLTFKHLYDDTWGHICKPEVKHALPIIIFPYNFTPVHGKEYTCSTLSTSATFVYNGTEYNVMTAFLENSASSMEKMDYKYKKQKKVKTAIELAFENAKH